MFINFSTKLRKNGFPLLMLMDEHYKTNTKWYLVNNIVKSRFMIQLITIQLLLLRHIINR